jgi:peptidyl-prolyl cis-trans isomerase D
VAGLFDLNEGNATLLEDTASITVLRLDAVTTPDQNAPEAQALRTALDQQAAQAMAQDILSTLARAVEAEAGISINQAALNAVHSQMQ